MGFPSMNASRHFCCAATLFLTVTAQQLHALPVLRLFDGTSTLTITSNTRESIFNVVTFMGSWGNWDINISGRDNWLNPNPPGLSLTFDVTSSGPGGTLIISLSDNNFGWPTSPPPNHVIISGSGSIAPGGSALYEAFRGYDNVLFSNSLLYGSIGPRTGAFSYREDAPSDGYYIPGLYSLTQTVSITHAAGPAHSTGRASIIFVPESGLSISLFAIALFGIGAAKRRLRLSESNVDKS